MLKLEARRQAKLHSIMLSPGFDRAHCMEAVITGESRWRR
jgi:hypothetical protein